MGKAQALDAAGEGGEDTKVDPHACARSKHFAKFATCSGCMSARSQYASDIHILAGAATNPPRPFPSAQGVAGGMPVREDGKLDGITGGGQYLLAVFSMNLNLDVCVGGD